MGYSSFGVFITVQVMAVSWQSTSHHDTVNANLKSLYGHQHIQFACTGKLNDLYRWGILQPQSPGQIGRSIGAVFATISYDL
jgi:hypothetical protein